MRQPSRRDDLTLGSPDCYLAAIDPVWAEICILVTARLPCHNPAPIDIDQAGARGEIDRKSTRLNSSHLGISYAVFCLKKKKTKKHNSARPATRHRHINTPLPQHTL